MEARAEQMRGESDQIVERVLAKTDAHLRKHYYFLVGLWDEVKALDPTRAFILHQWNALVDVLVATSRGKRSTREASAFTLERFAKWPEAMTTWLSHPHIEGPARMMYTLEYARHYLAGIIGQLDEVCPFLNLLAMYLESNCARTQQKLLRSLANTLRRLSFVFPWNTAEVASDVYLIYYVQHVKPAPAHGHIELLA